MTSPPFSRIAADVKLGHNVTIHGFVNLYGCEIGDDTKVGAFVEIQKDAKVGQRCKVSSHTFICEGVTIEDECFIGHHVVFINDRYPAAVTARGEVKTAADWQVVATRVCRRAALRRAGGVRFGGALGGGARGGGNHVERGWPGIVFTTKTRRPQGGGREDGGGGSRGTEGMEE